MHITGVYALQQALLLIVALFCSYPVHLITRANNPTQSTKEKQDIPTTSTHTASATTPAYTTATSTPLSKNDNAIIKDQQKQTQLSTEAKKIIKENFSINQFEKLIIHEDSC